ncbi:hypothetical protein ACB094_12G013900 [Castanea mollissima]
MDQSRANKREILHKGRFCYIPINLNLKVSHGKSETSQFSATEHRVLSNKTNKNNYSSTYTREQERYHCTSHSSRMEVKDSQQAIWIFFFFFQVVIWNLLNGKLGFCQCVWRTTGWEGNKNFWYQI